MIKMLETEVDNPEEILKAIQLQANTWGLIKKHGLFARL